MEEERTLTNRMLGLKANLVDAHSPVTNVRFFFLYIDHLTVRSTENLERACYWYCPVENRLR